MKTLLDRLRKRHSYIAVCVTKTDSLGVYREPEPLIEAYFGAEMFRLLESYKNAQQYITMEYFSVSAMGYLDMNRQVPNFNPLTDNLQDLNRWEPYRVESPFFWLFNAMEKERLLFERHAEMCKVFSNPVRLRILDELREGERSVQDLANGLREPLATVSQHLQMMKARRVVAGRRSGTLIFYRLTNPRLGKAFDLIHSILMEELRKEAKEVL